MNTLSATTLGRRLGRVIPALVIFITLAASGARAESLPGLKNHHRILILGDSITYAGLYVDDLRAYVVSHDPDSTAEFLNLGLSSETVSGLSEPGHAGGKFRRPDLHERLGRILAKVKPDLVIACYGMNDGIYQPLDAGRFQKFKDGMAWLHQQVVASGAKIIHVTPPVYDPQVRHEKPFADGTDYNTVLDAYSAWLVSQRTNHWEIIDIHTPMNHFLAQQRQHDPAYALTKDGIHPGAVGHWLMARGILVDLGAPPTVNAADDVEEVLPPNARNTALLKTVTELDTLLRDAWLTETKFIRPGVKPGLPLPEAEAKAAQLQTEIHALAVAASTP